MTGIRTIAVGALARVEGEGALRVRVRDGAVEIVEFNIYEPPRFFERLLVGRHLDEVPDIVARICGICPVAYQMTACRALEAALGIDPPPGVSALRRLLYHGEWIQSHALHVHLLHLPDFLGFESGFAMAAKHPQLFESGFRMKGLGNRIMEVVGGRAVHPVNVAVGGFHAWPDVDAVRGLVPDLERGLADALTLVDRVAGLEFPPFAPAVESVSLRPDSGYPLDEGRIVSSAGLDILPDAFTTSFAERQVPWSTALHCLRLPGETPYLVGPLSRMRQCRDALPPRAAAAAGAAAASGDQAPAASTKVSPANSPCLVTAARRRSPSVRQPVTSASKTRRPPSRVTSAVSTASSLRGSRWASLANSTAPAIS